MAKWRRGGGRRRGRWVIEYVEREPNGQWSTVNGQLSTDGEADPFTFDSPQAMRASLWRFEQRKMLEDYHSPVVCDA